MELKKITLDDIHRALGARMVPFAGYEMPVQYRGIIQEHQCVRKNLGLFDVSHMGVAKISGPQVQKKLNEVFTRDIANLEIGKGAYTLLCRENGNTVDDLILYRTGAEEFTFVLNAGNKHKDVEYIKSLPQVEGLKVEGPVEEYSILALQGPKAYALLADLGMKPEQFKAFYIYNQKFTELSKEVMVAFTGYTGETGCEIIVPNEEAKALWQLLMSRGEKYGIQPIGLGARDTLRTEMGFSLYGHEITEEINPIEAGLSWAVALKKDQFIGKLALQEAKEKPQRKLICLESPEKRAPRPEMKVFDAADQEVGFVTSGTFAPSLQKAIGMALVKRDSTAPYSVEIRGKKIAFELSKRPFYTKNH